MRSGGKFIVIAAALMATAGCANGEGGAAATATVTVTATTAPAVSTPSTSPTPSRSTPPPPRWSIECYFTDPTSRFDIDRPQTFFDLRSVWQQQAQSDLCMTEYTGGGAYVATPEEQAVIDVLSPHWEQGEEPQNVYGTALSTCAATGDDPVTLPLLYAKASALLCPEAPTGEAMRAVAAGTTFVDGNHVVGDNGIAPGSYRTTEEARNCYWERTSASGSTIDNDFVTFAPGGAEMRVKAGEGFVSDGCGTWVRK